MTGRLQDDVDWPVRTSRLALRPGTEEDVEATWEFRRFPEVSRWQSRADTSLED